MYPSPVEFLKHILDECNYLQQEYETNSFDTFIQNIRLSKAVCRSLEIIGEATHKLPLDLKVKYPFVSWKEMGDMRNRIIHDYFGVDYDILYGTRLKLIYLFLLYAFTR